MTPLLWLVDRAAGLVLLVLLTSALVTGLRASVPRPAARVPRFATLALHRNLALLAVALLAVHVGTSVADSFVDLAWWQVVVPSTLAGVESDWAFAKASFGAPRTGSLPLAAVTRSARCHGPN